jgi:5'-nucleotidase
VLCPRAGILLGALLATGAAAAEPRPRILLANDDGIEAPGLLAAYAELAKLGEVTVAAPATNQSGVGHGVTYLVPILVREIEPRMAVPGGAPQGPWYRIEASPATCVRLALTSLLKEKPDLVVSGINRGDNAGLTLHISGTLAAAREAAFDRIPAIGASLVHSPAMDYRPGAEIVGRLAALALKHGLPPGTFLALNVPAGAIKGLRVVPHSLKNGTNRYDRRESPTGQLYFWNVWTEPVDDDPDTDVGAITNGYAAVTPLRIDQNDEAARKTIGAWDLR